MTYSKRTHGDQYGRSDSSHKKYDSDHSDSHVKQAYNGHHDHRHSSQEPGSKNNNYVQSSITGSRPESEVEDFMERNEISVKGTQTLRPIQTFRELDVPDFVLEPLKRNKFEKPTPIQAQSWPLALSGLDVVGIAQTGSGKTYSFILPAIVHIKSQTKKHKDYNPVALVLCPTRELCQQISQVALEFARVADVRVVTVYGGAPKSGQSRDLYRGADIVVATPGRLLDFMESRTADVSEVSYLVLDEADRMLDMGFEPQIRKIIKKTRQDRQTLMFSATWPKEVHKLANEFLCDYIKVNIGAQDLHANHKITQIIHMTQEHHKFDELKILLQDIMNKPENKTIIFVETKRKADQICQMLYRDRFPIIAMHGDKNQVQRDSALKDFRSGRTPLLIATDVASRGIDVRDIKFVINYDYPNNSEDYVHRIGRTARSTDSGVAHTFFTDKNDAKARDLVKVLQEAGQEVPRALLDMSKKFIPDRGSSRYRGGYGGRPRGSGNHSYKKW